MRLLPLTRPEAPPAVRGALTAGVDDAGRFALCSLTIGDALFGIDTRTIKEVLGHRTLCKVPLAPAWIGGVVPYRGEVLTTVSFRALLGLPPCLAESCVMVLEDGASGEHFGLMVDEVGGVVVVDQGMYTANPTTLGDRSSLLYDGVFAVPDGLLILLTSGKLRPARLGSELFPKPAMPMK